jgi:hypothetical protein
MLSRRVNANVVVLLLVGALAAPQVVWADDSGGASVTGGGGPSLTATSAPTTGTGGGSVQPGDLTTSASANGIRVRARISALLRHGLSFTGTVASPGSRSTVVVERLDRAAGWVQIAHTTARGDGSFTAVWLTNHIGHFTIRARVRGPVAHSRAAADSPTLNVTVYRPAVATQFGEGFYGQTTACGHVLTTSTLGVAHRWLKCGTLVSIYYGGRTIVVPVIDRGPYGNNADWDLTWATGRALGMDGTQTIGAVALRARS